MRRLTIIPLLVLAILVASAAVFYVVQSRRAAAPPPVIADQVGAPPAVTDGSVPAGSPPPLTPLPGNPPETPEAERSAPEIDLGTPPALPANIQNLPAPAAATQLLKSLPAMPPDAPGNAASAPTDLALAAPIDNLHPRDVRDTFNQGRDNGRTHEASDIMAPLNTPVKAVADGTIAKLFLSKLGGITIYQFDPTRTYSYYYAHLDHYAPNLKEGQPVKRGDIIGYVGTTGNTGAKQPHLHFAMFRLLPDKKWWHGTPINPYPYLLKALAVQ